MYKEKENTSQKILSTALECLSVKGYANVSMRDIANEAGVALSQLTYHYKSKEGLFTEVVNQMINKYLREIESKLSNEYSPEKNFSTLVLYFKDLIRKKPEQLKLFFDFSSQALWNPLFAEQLNRLFGNIVDLIEKEILTEYMKSGKGKRFFGYSAGSVAKLIIGAIYGASLQIVLDTGQDKDMEALDFAEFLLY